MMATIINPIICLFGSGSGCVFVSHGRLREAGVARLTLGHDGILAFLWSFILPNLAEAELPPIAFTR
jgi:hypothetical protein